MEQGDVWDRARRERGGHQKEGNTEGEERKDNRWQCRKGREGGVAGGGGQQSPSTNDYQINEIGGTKRGPYEQG